MTLADGTQAFVRGDTRDTGPALPVRSRAISTAGTHGPACVMPVSPSLMAEHRDQSALSKPFAFEEPLELVRLDKPCLNSCGCSMP